MTIRYLLAVALANVLASAGVLAQKPTPPQYFPPRVVSDIEGAYYSAALLRMGERPLVPTQSPEREVYRFLWAPAFDPYTVVRIERDGDRTTLTATRVTRNQDGVSFGKVEPRLRKTLSATEWTLVRRQLSAAALWSMTSEEPQKRGADGNAVVDVDGDAWVLEVADGRGHHVVARWHHEEYQAFEAACYCMLELSGLEQALKEIEGYGHGVKDRLTTHCIERQPKNP